MCWHCIPWNCNFKKSLKIPNEQWEAVNQRTDKAMAKVQKRQKDKKSLKRPKGHSEAVNWRRTDNATTKRKKTKDAKYYTEN
jgi:hypothetical protein